MNNEQMQPLLKAWFRARSVGPADVPNGVAQVMGRVPQTRQRGRWWPLPALDRPLSMFPDRELAPAPIPAPNGRQPTRGFTMFSAVKFMVASVIVALFGGFLMMGVFTMRQSEEVPPAAVSASPTIEATSEPTEAPERSVRSDLLPGVALTVKEVEPGVFRVLHDGVRRLSPFKGWALTAGMDGSLWGTRDWRFFRVGGRSYKPPEGREYGPSIVAPDGTVWDWHEGEIVSFDGRRWKVRKKAQGYGFDIGWDGTVWATWQDANRPGLEHLARFTGNGWERTGVVVPGASEPLFVNREGDIWHRHVDDEGSGLHHLVDGEWQRLGPPLTDVDVGEDGTVWLLRQPEPRIVEGGEPGNWDDFLTDADGNVVFDYEDILMRFDGTEWQEWGPADGVPGGFGGVKVARDGSAWGTSGQETCEGVFRFDGTDWDRYLPDRCIYQFQVAPDDSIWVLAGTGGNLDDGNWIDLYVITPEAVAARE